MIFEPDSDPDLLDDFETRVIMKAATEQIRIIDQHIRLTVKSNPWWIPKSLWRRIAGKFIVLKIKNSFGVLEEKGETSDA